MIWQTVGAEPEKGYLLVVLHGRGDSADGFTWLQQELGIPGLSLCLLNAPDKYYTGFSWYDLPPDQLPGIVRSRGILTETLNEILKSGYSPDRCFLLGFSQGCMMTLEFGARYPSVLAGYIGISGYCYDPKALLAEANPEVLHAEWLITHGTQDEVLPVLRTRAQMQELVEGGMDLEYREYVKGHTIEMKSELPYLREWITTRMRDAT